MREGKRRIARYRERERERERERGDWGERSEVRNRERG